MLQAGVHQVHVLSSVINKTSNDNWQVVVTFADESGESIDAFLAMTDKAFEYTERKLKRLGYDLDAHNLDVMPLNAGEHSPIVGAETTITVIEEEYNGRPQLRVDRIGSGGGATAMPEADALAFATKLRERLIASRGVPKAPPPTAPGVKPPF